MRRASASSARHRFLFLLVYGALISARCGSPARCRPASSRRPTRAMPSSRRNCRTARRWNAPTRWCTRRSESVKDVPGVGHTSASRLLRRDLHGRVQRRRDLRAAEAVRRAVEGGTDGAIRSSPRSRSGSCHPGRLRHRDQAADGAGPRQGRRLQDADPGPRAASAWRSSPSAPRP